MCLSPVQGGAAALLTRPPPQDTLYRHGCFCVFTFCHVGMQWMNFGCCPTSCHFICLPTSQRCTFVCREESLPTQPAPSHAPSDEGSTNRHVHGICLPRSIRRGCIPFTSSSPGQKACRVCGQKTSTLVGWIVQCISQSADLKAVKSPP